MGVDTNGSLVIRPASGQDVILGNASVAELLRENMALRQALAAVTRPGIYCFGGLLQGDQSVAFRYDPEARAVEAVRPLSLPRHAGAASRVANDIHLMGGTYGDVHEVYNPLIGTYRRSVPEPVARHGARAATIGTRVYLVGGHQHPKPTPSMISFDATEGTTWSTNHTSMRVARVIPAVVPHLGFLVVLGGTQDASAGLPDVERYNPLNDMWEDGPTLPQALVSYYCCAASFDGNLYFFGGHGRYGMLKNSKWTVLGQASYSGCDLASTYRDTIVLITAQSVATFHPRDGRWDEPVPFADRYAGANHRGCAAFFP